MDRGIGSHDAGNTRKFTRRQGSGQHSRGREGQAHDLSEGDGSEAVTERRGARLDPGAPALDGPEDADDVKGDEAEGNDVTGLFCPKCHSYIPPIPNPAGVDSGLVTRMIARADADGLAVTHLLRIRAAELEARLDVEAPGWTAQDMIGAWVRARHVWSDYTEKPIP